MSYVIGGGRRADDQWSALCAANEEAQQHAQWANSVIDNVIGDADTVPVPYGPGEYPTSVLATEWSVSVMTGDGLPALHVYRRGEHKLDYHPVHNGLRFPCSDAAWSYAFVNGLVCAYSRVMS